MPSSPKPTAIGNYTISGLLGQGGMGAVYRGVHVNGGSEVAIKVMRSHGNEQEEARFLAEARVLQKIKHPHVIRCLDVGECDQGLYMVLDLITGGDVRAAMQKAGGRLEETRALQITEHVARGLEALEEAGLVHRDIKPDNIFLGADGRAILADFGVVREQNASQHFTQAGMPVGTVAYMAPEQAEAQGQIDIRTDIYALGATLFTMLAGRAPFLGENPMMTMLMVVNEPFPDLRKLRADCDSGTIHLINKATAKERVARYQHARELADAIGGVLEHIRLQAEAPVTDVSHRRRPTPVHLDSAAVGEESHGSGAGQRMLDNLDGKSLQRVMQRVRIHENALSAWINLAPETSFPSILLKAVLNRRGVIYGVREGAILDASRSTTTSRRVVVAHGDPPSPGCAGRDIFGQQVPPLRDLATVTMNEDLTEAWLLTMPGQLAPREAVQRAIVQAGVRFGILREAITAACEGPPSADGRRLIAQGRPLQEAQAPGFMLCQEQGDGDGQNLSAVHHGDIIALWSEGGSGTPGMDVCANPIPVPAVRVQTPEDLAGEGTDVGRDRQGRMVLRAARGGHVQRRLSGEIRVVRLREINGDLGPNDPELASDDVVLIKGSVRSGARISCANDIVIEGDLEDAAVDAGGSIEVHGDVRAGAAPVIGVDAIMVQGNIQRRVVAGNLRVEGKVEHCELVATGDITLRHVVGGSVTAGGSVRVAYAGDDYATTTELWAGRNLPYDDQERMARLAERRLAAERQRMIEECQVLSDELANQERRGARLQHALRPEVLQRHKHMLERMEARWAEAESIRETSRERLAQQRHLLQELGGLARNGDCEVSISVLAKPGVVVRMADTDPLRLREERHRFHLRLDGR